MQNDHPILHEVEFFNAFAFSEKKISLGKKLTEISGKNHTFKSCVIEGIRAGTSGGSTKDTDLVKEGEAGGKIVITINENGEKTKITKTLYPDKASKLGLVGPTNSTPAQYLAEIFGAGYINPVEFFNANADKRMEMLLKVLPFDFDREEFGKIVGATIKTDTKALTEIDLWHKKYYAERAESNRDLKSKTASALEYERTLPIADPIAPSAKLSELRNDKKKEDDAWKLAIAKADTTRDTRKNALEAVRDEAIKKATAEYNAGLEALTAKVSQYKSDINAAHLKVVSLIDGEMGTLIEQEKNAERIGEQRRLLAKMKKDADLCKEDWEMLDKKVKQIESVRESLLRKLPIDNLSLHDGEIYHNGTPWHLVNRAQRVLISNAVAELSCGRMKLILVDDLESLDADNYAEFIEHIKKSEYQYVISKVGDSEEMKIETID